MTKLRVYLITLCIVTSSVVLFTHLSYHDDGNTVSVSKDPAPHFDQRSLLHAISVSTNHTHLSELRAPSRTQGESPSPPHLIPLHWTSVHGSQEDDSYHFFSAYFDCRASADLQRPAVIVMGYVYTTVKAVDIYCKFTYGDGSTTCSNQAAPRRHPAPCFPPQLAANPYHYLCTVREGKGVPVGVQMSMSADCEAQVTSAVIPVQNRDASLYDKPRKKFGICIGGPLVKERPQLLEDVVEYVEMSGVLGVDQVMFYVNETQVDRSMLDHLWEHYPHHVHTVGWRGFEKWHPMHYYGQMLIISDCLYRSMYQVEYLAVIDLDEMILPIKHSTWAEMMATLDTSESVSSYTFQNNFFTAPDSQKEQIIANCSQKTVPKYFTRTVSHECYPGHAYRPKAMYVPRRIYEANIHWPCARVPGHEGNVNVPPDVALLGHYRTEVLDDCKDLPVHTDETASRFRTQVISSLCRKRPL